MELLQLVYSVWRVEKMRQLEAASMPHMWWRKQIPKSKNIEKISFRFRLYQFLKVLHVLMKKSTYLFTADTLDITNCNFLIMMQIIKNSDIIVCFLCYFLLPISPFTIKCYVQHDQSWEVTRFLFPVDFGTRTVGLQCLCLRLYLIKLVIFSHPHRFSAKQNFFLSGALCIRWQWSFSFKQSQSCK